jgi:hypothetical protein
VEVDPLYLVERSPNAILAALMSRPRKLASKASFRSYCFGCYEPQVAAP